MLKFFCILIVLIIISFVGYLNRSGKINKIETEGLEPLLDKLYKEPTSKVNNHNFLQVLKQLEITLKKYKSNYEYMPNKAVFEKLFRHLEKYPTDLSAHKRFESIVTMAKYINSETVFIRLIEHIDNYPTGNRSRGGYIMRINLKALLSKSFEVYAHNKIVPKMSKRQLADQYSTFNYSQLSGENQI